MIFSTAALIMKTAVLLFLPVAVQGKQTLYEWFISINPAVTDLLHQSPGMVDLLNGTTTTPSLLTLFAPTEEAYMSINSRVREYLADPSHSDVLQDILEGHVISGQNLTSDKLYKMKGQNVTFMNKETSQLVVTNIVNDGDDGAVTQQQENSVIQIDQKQGGATVTQPDAVYASNGMGHAINRVLGIISVVDMLEEMSSSGALPVSLSSILDTATDVTGGANNAGAVNEQVVENAIENAALTLFAPNTAAFLIFGFSNPQFASVMKEKGWYIHTASLLAKHLTKAGVLMQEDFANGTGVEVKMLNQESVYIEADGPDGADGTLFAIYPSMADMSTTTLATVVDADVLAYEGVIHMIDRVLVPDFMELTVMDVIQRENPTLATMMLDLVPDIVTSLEETFGVTVFLPSTEALANIDLALMNYLQSPQGADMLATILNYHIVASNVPTTSMENEMVLKTGFGIDEDNTSAAATLTVQRKGTAIVIAGNEGVTSTIAKENRLAKNGLVHLMDTVLVPGSLPATLPQIPIGSDTSSPGNDNNNAGGVDSSSTNVGGTSGADTTSITRPLVVATIVAATTSMVWAL